MKTNCVIIDNYDSFTYNLVHLIKELGLNVTVVRNNQFSLEDLNTYDRIVLSPGPGIPSEAGLLLDVIKHYAGIKPILGVCLGHQAIGEVFGAKLKNLSDVFHSWVVEKEHFPNCLEIIAESKEGLIMALRHRTYNIYGIQFHPESVLTPDGKKIMANWLRI